MWNRFPEKSWPSWLSTSVSHVQCLLSFQLSFSSSVSVWPRCTHQRRRRHIVFITRLLPAGPGLALIGWLTWMSQLNMQHFPFSSLSHQEIRSVTAQRIQAGTCVHITLSQLCRLARTCTAKPRRKRAFVFLKLAWAFVFVPVKQLHCAPSF